MKFTAISVSLVVLTLLASAYPQDLPDKIRGYKVYTDNLKVANYSDHETESNNVDVFVRLGKPKIVEIGIAGLSLEIGSEITATKQSGRVDRLIFRDFRVNGIAVEVEEYSHPFSFNKNEMTSLPLPARVNVGITSFPRAVYSELIEKSDEFAIAGTIFVFAKFKKLGFTFKRVIPLKIDLRIKNPLHSPPRLTTNVTFFDFLR